MDTVQQTDGSLASGGAVVLQTSGFTHYDGDAATIRFANPSEMLFARMLDYYRIHWLYEPRTFVLATRLCPDGTEVVAEAFTPDFYLVEQGLYIELTTMRQPLATRKHRKRRKLGELYPEIKFKLFERRDLIRLDLSRFDTAARRSAEETAPETAVPAELVAA